MTLGLAVLGTEHSHLGGKLQAVAEVEGVEVVGLFEPEADARARRQAEEPFAALRWFDSAADLLSMDNVRGVIVDGRVDQNIALAADALSAGKPVLLEKPAGTTADDLPHLLKIASQSGAFIQMGYQFRYLPGFSCVRRLVMEGYLGRVFFVRARIGKDKGGYDGLERELRKYKGGTFFELGCHPLDFIIGLMGEPTNITGFLRTDHRDDTPLADNTVGVVEFAGGLGVVESSMMEIAPFPRRRLEVYGDEGTAILQPFDATSVELTLENDREPYRQGTQQVDAGNWPTFVGDIKEFAACIRGEREPEYSGAHDLAVQKALLQACGGA